MTAKPRQLLRTISVPFSHRTLFGLSVFASVALSAAPVPAQSAPDGATAQALFDRAKKLMGEGKYAEACPVLEESERVESRSGTALNLADCYEHAGRLASAWSTFLEAATLAKATGNTARENGARQRAAALAQRLSKLVIGAPSAGSTPGLEISRDGERIGPTQWGLPMPTDAGKHTVTATAPGRRQWQTTVTVQDGASTTNVVVPDLESSTAEAVPAAAPAAPAAQSTPPAPERAANHLSTGVIAGGVVTGVFAVGTVITAVLYNGKLHDYNTANDQLAANRSDLHSQTRTLGAANLALLGGTLVAAGVTVFLWTRTPSQETATSARLELRGLIGPGLTGLSVGGSL